MSLPAVAPGGGPTDRPLATHPMYTPTLRFALGALILLAVAPVWPREVPWLPGIMSIVAVPVCALFLSAWDRLYDAIPTPWNREGSGVPTLPERAMPGVYGVSLVLVALGFGSLLFLYPNVPPFLPAEWLLAVMSGAFLNLPAVWAPTVIGQGVLFLLGAMGLEDRRSLALVVAGVAVLFALGVLGLGVQAGGLAVPGTPWWALSGLTAAGYGLAALGWKREAQTPAALR